MAKRIFEAALENRLLTIIAVLVLTGLGLRAMTLLPIDAVPDVTPNVVQVVTDAPGLGPAEVEKFITFPVEIAMRGMPGISEIRSLSRFGLSSVWIYFDEKYDIYFARRLVMERLPAARELIPKGYGSPEMTPGIDRAGRDLPVRSRRSKALPDAVALDPGLAGRAPAQGRARRGRSQQLRRRAQDLRSAARARRAGDLRHRPGPSVPRPGAQ